MKIDGNQIKVGNILEINSILSIADPILCSMLFTRSSL